MLNYSRSLSRATRVVFLVCVVSLSAALPLPAVAESINGATEGVVIQVEKDDVIVDLGSARGADNDDVVEIWRPMRLKHPITGKVIVDRFRIGRLRLIQVRPNLSLARPERQLARDAQSGDIVVSPKREVQLTALPPAPAAPHPPTPQPPAVAAPRTSATTAATLSPLPAPRPPEAEAPARG